MVQMNNEPVVAYINKDDGLVCAKCFNPLYTHPAKTLTDDPLVNFKPVWQEKPELTLTDEEILEFKDKVPYSLGSDLIEFARAILRKAQEK
jgi:hypothetical protein